jgi:hypothetical protein
MQKEIRVLYIDPKVMVEPKRFSMLFNVDFMGESDDSVPIDPEEAIDICTNLGWSVKDMSMTEDQKIKIVFER